MMLAMVPVSDVPDAFAYIADSIPRTLDLLLREDLGQRSQRQTSTIPSGDLEPDRQSGDWDGRDLQHLRVLQQDLL